LERAVLAAKGLTNGQWLQALDGRPELDSLPADPTRWLVDLGSGWAAELAHPRRLTLVHGSWHMGQVGHPLLSKRWRLIDPDDLGVGDPVWDLARPAAMYLSGQLELDFWGAFVTAYREAGGLAIPASGDYWPALLTVARATVLMSAVHALATPDAHRPETTAAFIRALDRVGA
jgi:hypothetical protein